MTKEEFYEFFSHIICSFAPRKTIEKMGLATSIHEGSWDKFSQSYSSLIGEIMKSGRMLNGVAREVYLNIDFENSENNITEIQLGVKSLE